MSVSEKTLYGSFRPTEQVALAWQRTQEIADIVDARVIVFQCPASFLPTSENIRNFESFFRDIPRGRRIFAWEPRSDDWDERLVRDLCSAHRLVHCVDPFVRDSTYGEPLYWRLHGKGGYRYRYSENDLVELSGKLQGHADPAALHYIMFNNISSQGDALRFASLCAKGDQST